MFIMLYRTYDSEDEMLLCSLKWKLFSSTFLLYRLLLKLSQIKLEKITKQQHTLWAFSYEKCSNKTLSS